MFQINHLIRSSLISVLLLTASIPVLAVNAGQTARNAAVPDATIYRHRNYRLLWMLRAARCSGWDRNCITHC
jgi:phosphoribosylcarboxyaminoimidazole (NCAIR) mutase